MPEPLLVAPALHHVGLVVRDLDAAIARYRALGFGEPEVVEAPEQGVRVATFLAGPGLIELLTPTDPASGVARFLESRGEGMHHVAYRVPNILAALRTLEAAGYELIDREPRLGVHGFPVAFVHPRSVHGVLTELVEVPSA